MKCASDNTSLAELDLLLVDVLKLLPIGGDDNMDRKFNMVGCIGGTGIRREELLSEVAV